MKQYRLKELDKDLLYIERLADSRSIDIDNTPAWQALCAIVTEYHMGERRYSSRLLADYGKARVAVMLIVGGD